MNKEDLSKYIVKKRIGSPLNQYIHEIKYLREHGARLQDIQVYLTDRGISTSQSNISAWLKRNNILYKPADNIDFTETSCRKDNIDAKAQQENKKQKKAKITPEELVGM